MTAEISQNKQKLTNVALICSKYREATGLEKTQQITISARMIDHSMTGARQAGIDLNRLLRQCGIEKELLKQPGARLPLDKVMKLARYTSIAMQDEATGLLHKPVPLGQFRMMAYATLHAGTLGRALQRAVDFSNLFDHSLQYTFAVKGNQVQITLKRIPGHKIVDNQALDATMTVLHRFAGWLCNERILLDQVSVDFPAPDYHEEYQYMYYGAPILFNQTHYSISFDRRYLDHKIVQNDASLESYIRRAPLDVYLPLDAGGPITRTVRKLTREAFAEQHTAPTLELIAASMQINSQTLRRRLKEEGISFHTLKAQVRRDIAIHHLGNPEASMEQIAAYTGYTEASAFIRAFKAWTGFTPLNFRKGMEVDEE